MAPEASREETEHGTVFKADGWYVLNARDARWYHVDGRGAHCDFEGDAEFSQLGMNIMVLGPGEAMDHWEADQEDFLVVSGVALLIIEGEERPLRTWDFVHCPPNAKHTIVGAGEGPCVVVAVGARIDSVDNRIGAATRSTPSRFATRPVSRRRRPSPTPRTQRFGRSTARGSHSATATAGCRSAGTSLAHGRAMPHGSQATFPNAGPLG